jgi:hypothetical protein
MPHAGTRHVTNDTARSPVAILPLLLLARVGERRVELAELLDRVAAQEHVRTPRVGDLAVAGPGIEEGEGRPVATAGARGVALEAGPDRTAEHVATGPVGGGLQVGGEPALVDEHVVVEQDDQRPRRALQSRVARGVRPLLGQEGVVAHPGALGHRPRRRVPAVVDDEDLGAVRRGLRQHRLQRDAQVARALAGGNEDRCDGRHHEREDRVRRRGLPWPGRPGA